MVPPPEVVTVPREGLAEVAGPEDGAGLVTADVGAAPASGGVGCCCNTKQGQISAARPHAESGRLYVQQRGS